MRRSRNGPERQIANRGVSWALSHTGGWTLRRHNTAAERMNPSSAKAAGRQAAELLRCHFRGASAATRKRRYRSAALIANHIWSRWQVGVFRWRLMHIRWYLEHHMRARSRHTRYQHYLCIKDVLAILGEDHWIHRLHGPWIRPSGESGALGNGRPRAIRVNQ